MQTYYWKVKHIPSQEYLLRNSTGTTLHTNQIGAKFTSVRDVNEYLDKEYKVVKGPQSISFERNDFLIEKYMVSLVDETPTDIQKLITELETNYTGRLIPVENLIKLIKKSFVL